MIRFFLLRSATSLVGEKAMVALEVSFLFFFPVTEPK